MSCVIRVSGKALDIDALLSCLPFTAHCFWRKGQTRGLATAQPHADAGANFIASNADFDAFDQQVTEAAMFLEKNSKAIAYVVSFPGVEQVTLDFAVSFYESSVAAFSYLPPAFIRLAAHAGLGIEISRYACSEEPSAEG